MESIFRMGKMIIYNLVCAFMVLTSTPSVIFPVQFLSHSDEADCADHDIHYLYISVYMSV